MAGQESSQQQQLQLALQMQQAAAQQAQFQQEQQNLQSQQLNAQELQQQTIQTGVSQDTQHLLRQFAATAQGTGISVPFSGVTGGMQPVANGATGSLRG